MASYKTLSIPDGNNTYSLDCSVYLKDNETIASYHVKPDDPTVMNIGSTKVNISTYINDNNELVNVGKGIIFELLANTSSSTTTYVYIEFEGTKGSNNKFKRAVPLDEYIE